MKKYSFFLVIILFIFILTAIFNKADWDLWARLAVGKIFFDTGWVLKHDIFAYTPTKPLWVDHEWLSGVVFYWFVQKFGELGLPLLKLLLLFSVFLSIFKLNSIKFSEQSQNKIIYYGFFIYSLMLGFEGTIRSQCFTYAFFALWLYSLELVKRGNNKLLLLFPFTIVFWANMHGGFFAGLGILVLYGLGEAFNKRNFAKYFITAGVSTLATLINPYGYKYWTYLADAIFMTRPFVSEWQPLDLFASFKAYVGFKIFAVLTVFALLIVLIKKLINLFNSRSFKAPDINISEILILGITFWLSIEHKRHMVFFIIASAGYITGYLFYAIETIMPFLKNKFFTALCKYKNIAVYSLVILLAILTLWLVPLNVKVNNTRFPVRAVEFIKQNKISGNLLVVFNWGSYALWKLYPRCRISVDGRYEEVYPEWFINEAARFHYIGKGSSWMDIINKYHTDAILVDKKYEAYNYLVRVNSWKVVYQDDISAVFVPVSVKKAKWKIPDKNYFEDDKKYITSINLTSKKLVHNK